MNCEGMVCGIADVLVATLATAESYLGWRLEMPLMPRNLNRGALELLSKPAFAVQIFRSDNVSPGNTQNRRWQASATCTRH